MTNEMATQGTQRFDVAVIGGGTAGLSAAVALGRARRSVVVIDAGAPRNAPAAGVHGFLSRDGISPMELIATGQKEVEHYGGVLLHADVQAARRTADGFEVVYDGRVVGARRLLVATGLVDELPDIPGVRERWGRDVVHCPYCHGWEIRDEPIGVLGTGPMAVHMTSLFRQWTSDLVLFTHTAPPLTDEQAEQFAARGVRVVPGVVDSLEVVDDRIAGVRMVDGTVVARRALVVTPRFVASSAVLASLGLRPTTHHLGIGECFASDPTGLTEVPGVWVAGNVTDLTAGVVVAAGSGVTAGAAINADLIAEDTRHAVASYRETRSGAAQPDGPQSAPSGSVPRDTGRDHGDAHHHHRPDHVVLFTKEFWDERYRSADRIWSGNPNPRLVENVTDLAPGTALDVGSGEGADAIWLASRGWRVTAVDVSTVALERAEQRAAEAGREIADRITWQQADVLTWEPEQQQFDLVSAQFMHLPRPALESLHRRLAAAVRPGGTLLIVGHHPLDLETSMGRPDRRDLLFTAEDVAGRLDPDGWRIVAATAPGRQAVDPDGRPVTLHDAVLHAVRSS